MRGSAFQILPKLRAILCHPLVRRQPVRVLARWLRWSLGSRLAPGAVVVPFVGETCLMGARGMNGAVESVHVGIAEFEDMAFLLHLLRPDDLFVDVGANLGAYSVLASGVVGASSLACEPVPAAFDLLVKNLRLNGIEDRVHARQIGVSGGETKLHITVGRDTMNHVVSGDIAEDKVAVTAETLDTLLGGRVPALLKIDVEGFEGAVLSGARHTLAKPSLRAAIIEINDCGRRYSSDSAEILERMAGHGFQPVAYDPLSRRLKTLDGHNPAGNNTLFVRDIDALAPILKAAPARVMHGLSV